MAGKKLKLNDFKKKVTTLSSTEMKQTNGGYASYTPGASSVGHIQWDEIDFRNLEDGPNNNAGSSKPLQPSRGLHRK